MIIDNHVIFILNQNFTASGFTKNRECNIINTNPQDVIEGEKIFLADWRIAQETPI